MQMDWNWIPNHRSEIERESRGDCFLVSVERERDVLSVGQRDFVGSCRYSSAANRGL